MPVHKKEDKTLIKNNRLISLLPIFAKIFEKIIYNSLFKHFLSNKLFIPSQSGFIPRDSCIAQLLSVIHEIQTASESNPTIDVIGVFLDISKEFVKVWHDGLIFKLKSCGAHGELFTLLKIYLQNRKQRVFLNCQTSGWRKLILAFLKDRY